MSTVDKNLKAAMERNFKREAKAQEKTDKLRENERKEEQKRAELKPAKEKWTKTITTTASRKRAREKAGYAEEDLSGSSEVVWKQKGSEAGKNIPAHAAVFDVLAFLKQRADYEEASLGEIREGTGIDLNAHAKLLEHLRGNIKVETIEEPGAPLRLRYMPAHGVRDRNSLLHVLKHTYPGAPDGHVESLPRSELPAEETFEEVDAAIDELIQSGRCSVLCAGCWSGKPCARCGKDKKLSDQEKRANEQKLSDKEKQAHKKKQVLFAPVEQLLHPLVCARASEAMRNLWHGEDLLGDKAKVSSYKDDMVVPKGRDLEAVLLQRKVRTAEQLERRKERHKAAAERKKEEQAEAARRKKKAPTFRTVSNTHVAEGLFGGHELRGQALEDANRRAAQSAQSQR